MKKIYLIFILLIGISISCTKDFEEFNTDQKKPVEVPGEFVFANAQKALADQVASTSVNLNIWKLVAQYWTETTYTDEANYDIVTRTIPDNTFRTYYRDILADFNNAKMVMADETVAGEDAIKAKANRLLIVDLCMAYSYNRMVDIFGGIPYTEALDIDNISPVYDEGFAIYTSLLEKIDAAIAGLDPAYGSFGDNDLWMHGDVTMWIKFAHSMKVKMGIALADSHNDLAKSLIEGSYDKAFGPNELCEMVYLGGSNSNPLYVDLVQSGRHDFVPANTIVDKMNTLEDPRRPAYFTLYDNGTPDDPSDDLYLGGIYGESNNWSNFSHIADPIQEPDFPMTLLDGIEISFYLAEAAARGYSVGGDAATHYAAGITASFNYWGISGADAYIATVPYSAANLAEQAWLAYYVRGLVAWNSWRRLDGPALNLPPAPETDDGQIPKRFTYPVNEQTLNKDNYYNAANAIPGGDKMSSRVFWDIN